MGISEEGCKVDIKADIFHICNKEQPINQEQNKENYTKTHHNQIADNQRKKIIILKGAQK